jgi:hypothetical protein
MLTFFCQYCIIGVGGLHKTMYMYVFMGPLPHAFTPRFWDITSTSFFLSQDKVTSSVTF